MGKQLIILTGKSGAGKSTMAYALGVPLLPVYTTRSQRDLLDTDYIFSAPTEEPLFTLETPVGEYHYMDTDEKVAVVTVIERSVAGAIAKVYRDKGYTVHIADVQPHPDVDTVNSTRGLNNSEIEYRNNLR